MILGAPLLVDASRLPFSNALLVVALSLSVSSAVGAPFSTSAAFDRFAFELTKKLSMRFCPVMVLQNCPRILAGRCGRKIEKRRTPGNVDPGMQKFEIQKMDLPVKPLKLTRVALK